MENNSAHRQAKQATGTSSEILVGVFDDYSNAQQALDTMLLAGFQRETLQLYPKAKLTEGGQDNIPVEIERMFGSSSDLSRYRKRSDIYAEAVRQGHYLLAVNAHTDEQIDQAAAIMNRFKVVDIEERAAHWERQGWTGYHENAEENRATMQKPQSTFQPADDDLDYRNHWQNTYGNTGGRYEDYDAAYHFGSAMARCGLYKNAQWGDVESQLRSGWESNHSGTWEKVKDAVGYGARRTYMSRH